MNAYETCPHCDAENRFEDWDVKKDGYVAVCHECGRKMMLCDECHFTDDEGNESDYRDKCDWHQEEGHEEGTCYRKYFKIRKEEEKTMRNFYDVCADVRTNFYKDWEMAPESACTREIMKRAMLGYSKEEEFLLKRITDLNPIAEGIDTSTIPSWYANQPIINAIYSELFGWGPVEEWFSYDYLDCDTFIITHGNCFIERAGHQKLMKQRASKEFLDRVFKTLSLTRSTNSDRYDETTFNLGDDVTLTITSCGDFIFNRPTPTTITKQDITLDIWNKFNDIAVGTNLDMDCIESCTMRKTNSFGIKLKDGREFKVIVKDIDQED